MSKLILSIRSSTIFMIVLLVVRHSHAQSAVKIVDDHPHYGEAIRVGEIENDKIEESSGLAASNLHPNTFWTHNDSGDKPRIFAFSESGRHLGTCHIEGATADDWEDISAFKLGKRSYLMIADVGDNDENRKSYSIYIAPEPEDPKHDVDVARHIQFKYEDGPHNCEAVCFDVQQKQFLLVEKRIGVSSRVYAFRWPREGEVGIAQHIGTIGLSIATGMDVSPDGRRMVVVSYLEAVEFSRELDEPWSDALERPGLRIAMPDRKQGETICYGVDGQTLYATSEKKSSPIFKIRRNPASG